MICFKMRKIFLRTFFLRIIFAMSIFISFGIVGAFFQEANAGWVSCQKKHKLLKAGAICGWVGGVVGIAGECAVGMAGGSVAEMVGTGLGAAGSLCLGYCASHAAKTPSLFNSRDAVLDIHSASFSSLVEKVQGHVQYAAQADIWNELQTLDGDGLICSVYGKYYSLELVAALISEKMKDDVESSESKDDSNSASLDQVMKHEEKTPLPVELKIGSEVQL